MAAVTAAVMAMAAAGMAQVTVPARVLALVPDAVVQPQEPSMEADHQDTRNGKPVRQTLTRKIVQKAANRRGPDPAACVRALRRCNSTLPARQLRAQIAQLRLEIADALEHRHHQGDGVRVQVEVLAQAARAPRNDQPVRAEGPMSCVWIDRREHSVIHELAQLFEQELMLLVQPHRLFGFHFAASCSKCPRGLKVETSASSLNSSRSRSLVTVGTAIWTIAKRSPSPACGLGRPRPASRSCRPACVPGGTLRRTDPPRVGTCTLVPSTASHGASGRSR